MASRRLKLYRVAAPRPPDTTPPTAPTSLVATLASNVVNLTWNSSTDNVQVTGYLIQRQLDGSGAFSFIVPAPGIPATTFTDTTVAAGHSAKYIVFATDAAANVSAASNTSNSVSVALSDTTAPAVPATPTLVTSNASASPPTFTCSWPSVADIDPGTGAPVTGENNYDVRINGAVQSTPVPNSVTIGAFTSFVIGTNNGGAPVTGSDTGGVLQATSVTGDLNATHYGPSDEYYTDGALVQGPGYQALHITAQSPFGGFSKVGIENRQDRSATAAYIAVLSFGPTNGLKAEFRLAAGAQAQGTALFAYPGTPFWLRSRWDLSWNFILEYSTDSTNPNPVGGNGTWTTMLSQAMSFGTQAYVNKFADANTSGGTGGTVSCTYDQYVVAGASPNVFSGTLVAGITNTVDVRSRDFAGNVSAFSSVLSIPIAASTGKPQPSFGAWLIGGPGARYDNVTFQTYASLMRTVVMQWFTGYDTQVSSQPMKTIMQNIKTRNPNTKCFLYLDATFTTTTNAIAPAGTANNWFLRTSFPSGTLVEPNGSISRVGNTVTGGPTDSAGRTWNTYVPAFTIDWSANGSAAGLGGSGNVANPLVDGYVVDDIQTRATASGDWLRTGSTTSGTATDTAIRVGNMQVQNGFRSMGKAGTLVGGNVSWFNVASLAEYNGNFDWLYMENMVGGGNGDAENNSNFATTLAIYQQMVSVLKPTTGIAVWMQAALNTDGSDILTWNSSTNTATTHSPAWQGVRYGFAFCNCMGDADYFPCGTDPFNTSGNGEPYSSAILRWFDWFSVNTTTGVAYSQANALSGVNWLGAAIDGPQTTTFQNGMYRRRYTNGEIWLNPRGNGAQTITFRNAANTANISVRLILSAQDPKQNGATVGTLAMGDRDGIAVLY